MSWARPACVSHLPSRGDRVSPRRRGGPRRGGQSCHCLRPSPDASLQNDKSVPGRITQPLRPMWLESGSSRVPRGRAPSPPRAASWGAGGSHLSTGLLRCLRGLPLRVPCTPRQVCALARSHRYLSPNLKHRQFKGQRTATTGAAFAGEPSPPPPRGSRGWPRPDGARRGCMVANRPRPVYRGELADAVPAREGTGF